MNTKMYVGDLSFDITEADLRTACGAHGSVTEVHLPMDHGIDRPGVGKARLGQQHDPGQLEDYEAEQRFDGRKGKLFPTEAQD